MDITFLPLKSSLRDSKFASAAVQGNEKKSVKIVQSWNCLTGSTTPKNVTTLVTVDAYFSYFNGIQPDLYHKDRRKLDERLKAFFLAKVVEMKPAQNQAKLNAALGKYQMKIPFNSIVFPTWKESKVNVISSVHYEYFRVVWQGMRRTQWVVLALPAGDSHALNLIGHCDGEGDLDDPEMEELTYYDDLRPANYKPKTNLAGKLRGATKRAAAKGIQDEIDKLEAKKKKLLQEAAELEGQ